jgi:hypothetical protein
MTFSIMAGLRAFQNLTEIRPESSKSIRTSGRSGGSADEVTGVKYGVGFAALSAS